MGGVTVPLKLSLFASSIRKAPQGNHLSVGPGKQFMTKDPALYRLMPWRSSFIVIAMCCQTPTIPYGLCCICLSETADTAIAVLAMILIAACKPICRWLPPVEKNGWQRRSGRISRRRLHKFSNDRPLPCRRRHARSENNMTSILVTVIWVTSRATTGPARKSKSGVGDLNNRRGATELDIASA